MIELHPACRRADRPAWCFTSGRLPRLRDCVPASRCESSLQCVGHPALRRVPPIHGLVRRPAIHGRAAFAARSFLTPPLGIRFAAAGFCRASMPGSGTSSRPACPHSGHSCSMPGSAGLSLSQKLGILPRICPRQSLGREPNPPCPGPRPSAPTLETLDIPI